MTTRTRFAPSPTGYLHMGSARTALYAWLYAKQKQGSFILRIEDTDTERSTPESVQCILDSMKWLGLDYDEGPYYQTKRFERYKDIALQLLTEKKAYRCQCTKERLEALRESQISAKEKPRYDGHCRDLDLPASEKPYVIRFRNPANGTVTVNDEVKGVVTFENSELDDLIIVRSDGVPTYNFCVVIDDWDMQITHVIRGDDHLNNTPRQMNILSALGADIPVYAHIPMILNEEGKRFSKRHGAMSILQYQEDGFLPQALLNYIVRLGWSYGDKEVFSVDEMIQHFDLKKINKAPAAFNPEKLLWLNQHYLKSLSEEAIAPYLLWQAHHHGLNLQKGPELHQLFLAQRDRAKTLAEMIEKSHFFYHDDAFDHDEASLEKHKSPMLAPALMTLYDLLNDLNEWTDESVHAALQKAVEEHQLKLGQLAQPVRVFLTGGTISPPIDKTIRLLGKKRTLARLEQAIASLNT